MQSPDPGNRPTALPGQVAPTQPASASAADAPPRRAWWAPLPFPPLPAISTLRAYVEVLGVFSAFFLTGVIAAALLLADRYKDLLNGASWAVYLTETVAALVEIGLAVVVVLLLSERRSVTPKILGLQWPRLDDGHVAVSRTVRIVAWAFLAQVLGGIVNALLQTGHLPTQSTGAPALVFSLADSVQAGVVEELVVLGFVVVTLRQAGRPLWEVCAVALVLRCSYHIYYGPGVAGILIWAAMFLWIYLRTGSLFPLMLSHLLWDAVAFFTQRWAAVGVVAVLLLVALWILAPVLWLIERNATAAAAEPRGWAPSRPVWDASVSGQWPPGVPAAQNGLPPAPTPPASLPPQGWHPDPSGDNRWRWWDGQRWTEHVSSHSGTGG